MRWDGESAVHKYLGDRVICIFGKGAVSLSKIRRERQGNQPIFLREKKWEEMKENLFLSTAFLFVDYDRLSWNVWMDIFVFDIMVIQTVNKEWNSLKISEFVSSKFTCNWLALRSRMFDSILKTKFFTILSRCSRRVINNNEIFKPILRTERDSSRSLRTAFPAVSCHVRIINPQLTLNR